MRLNKITEIGKTGCIHAGKSEIFTILWNDGINSKFFAFNQSKIIREVSKDYFGLNVFGEHHLKIEEQLPTKIFNYQKTNGLNGQQYFCTFQEDIVHGFDKNGNKNYEWLIEVGVGHPIYDIKFQEPDYLWLAFPTGQTVSQVSLGERKEVYRIGDYSWEDDNDYLSYPESIFLKDNFLYIPNMGNKKLFKVNLRTKEIKLKATFEEKIWQYEETLIGTFVVTDTGIYELVEW